MSSQGGGIVDAVRAGSAAADAGIRPGDIILSLDGHPLHDIIDYQFYLEPCLQTVEIERVGKRVRLQLDSTGLHGGPGRGEPGGDPGILIRNVIFDRIRTCPNRCAFCFVDQLPAQLRSALYLKDDDFRLSFLHGNFITLNNLGERAVDRIIRQRLSPLYVSVHATDPEVRGRVMGCSRSVAAEGLSNLSRLGEAGIELHAQIVYCPGLNSGEILEQTVVSLSQEYQGIKTAGIVPVSAGASYFKKHPESCIRPVGVDDCIEVIERVDAWQKRFRQETGAGFVYAADEFYLSGGRPLPPFEYYDGFSQYENGIGIARSFLAEGEVRVEEAIEQSGPDGTRFAGLGGGAQGRVFLLSGTLAAPLIEGMCGRLCIRTGRKVEPLVAGNGLFGPHVTVTGLLGGRDIMKAARDSGLRRRDLLLIPASALDSAGERFLDDLLLEELAEILDGGVSVVG